MIGRYFRSNKGQALVEMAIILPIVLLMVMAIISYGLYINAAGTIAQAARVGARAAAIGDTMGCPGDSSNTQLANNEPPTVYGIVDNVINNDTPWLKAGSQPLITFAAIIGNQSNVQQNNALITVVYPYHVLVPIPLLPSTINIAQTYQMMVQTPQPSDATTTTEPTGSPYYETSSWTNPAPPTTNVTYLTQPGGCS